MNNNANQEALRPHIGVIIGLLQDNASDSEVTEAGLATVVCIIYSVYENSCIQYAYIFWNTIQYSLRNIAD